MAEPALTAEPAEEESYPHFEDVLSAEKTHYEDYKKGLRAIGRAMGHTGFHIVDQAIKSGELPVQKVRNMYPGKLRYTFIARNTDIEDWKRRRQEAEENSKKQQQPLVLVPPPAAEERSPEYNLLMRLCKEQEETRDMLKSVWHEVRTLAESFK